MRRRRRRKRRRERKKQELSIEPVSEDLALSSSSSRTVDRYPSDKVSRNINQHLEMGKKMIGCPFSRVLGEV